MRSPRELARDLTRINLPATALHRGRVVAYRGTRVRIARSADVKIPGRLIAGRSWSGGAYPGHFLVHEGAALTVGGLFSFFTGLRVAVATGATLTLGSGYINADVRLSCYHSIHIGEGVAISERVTIRDSDNHSIDGKDESAPIHIGDRVWVGLGATILKGVTIGDGAVVAAGAVVNRDVPPGAVVGGVPAKVLRRDVTWK